MTKNENNASRDTCFAALKNLEVLSEQIDPKHPILDTLEKNLKKDGKFSKTVTAFLLSKGPQRDN